MKSFRLITLYDSMNTDLTIMHKWSSTMHLFVTQLITASSPNEQTTALSVSPNQLRYVGVDESLRKIFLDVISNLD